MFVFLLPFIHPGKFVFVESVSILDHRVWLLLELQSTEGDFSRQHVNSNHCLVLICRGIGQFLNTAS